MCLTKIIQNTEIELLKTNLPKIAQKMADYFGNQQVKSKV